MNKYNEEYIEKFYEKTFSVGLDTGYEKEREKLEKYSSQTKQSFGIAIVNDFRAFVTLVFGIDPKNACCCYGNGASINAWNIVESLARHPEDEDVILLTNKNYFVREIGHETFLVSKTNAYVHKMEKIGIKKEKQLRELGNLLDPRIVGAVEKGKTIEVREMAEWKKPWRTSISLGENDEIISEYEKRSALMQSVEFYGKNA